MTPELQKTMEGKNKNARTPANSEPVFSIRIFLASIHAQRKLINEKYNEITQ
jgi:hypothetical protein